MTERPTLHDELAAILRADDNRWMTTQELATEVNRRDRYRKRDGSKVDASQVHGRTKNYAHIFERDGQRVRLRELPAATSVDEERDLRNRLFGYLDPEGDIATDCTASQVREKHQGTRVFYGGRGIWYDAERTRKLMDPGVAIGVLHTGRHYSDDLLDDGIIYHYPDTDSPGKDTVEVAALKNAARLGLPVFVVIQRGSKREVRRSWVEGWNDETEEFSIRFGEGDAIDDGNIDPGDWQATRSRAKTRSEVERRIRDPRFRFRVLQMFGTECAVCGIATREAIEAAHIIPVSDDGSDHPGNGLPLCATHHRLFDVDAFAINPHTLEIVTPDGYTLAKMRVTRIDISNLQAVPHAEALQWRWERVFGADL